MDVVEWERLGLDERSLRARLLDIVEQLPQELKAFVALDDLEEIRSYIALLPEVAQEAINKETLESIYASVDTYREILPHYGFSGAFAGEYLPIDPRFEQIQQARRRYMYLIAAQELLRCIANPKMQERFGYRESINMSDEQKALRNVLMFARLQRYSEDTSVVLFVDQGKLEVSVPPLYQTLKGVELKRVRECPICQNIFWVGRLDQTCCSSKCSRTLRVRRWRVRYMEKYKQQRYQRAEANKRKSAESK
jgi:hypothetical protein